MSIFQGTSWIINLLPDWTGEHDEDCSTIYHPEGVGALQISAFSKDGKVTDEDLKDFAQDHIEAGAKLSESNSGDFKGFTLVFVVDNEFWQHWYVAKGNTALFITYNCEAVDREVEIDKIKTMVASLKTT